MNLLCALAISLALAPPPLKAGDLVVVKSPDARLRLGEKGVLAGKAFRVFKVVAVDDAQVMLGSDRRKGWARLDEVVPLFEGKALAEFDAKVRAEPRNADAHHTRGNLRMIDPEKSDPEPIRADLDQAVTLDRTEPEYRITRAHFLEALGDLKAAAADLDEAIKTSPRNAWAYWNRGVFETARGALDRAAADFERAVRLDPGNEVYAGSLGSTYALKGDNDKAIAAFDRALQLAPDKGSLHVGRAVSLIEKGDTPRALADLDRAIILDPEDAAAHYHRGRAFAAKGDQDRAIANFTRAIEIIPDTFADAYNERGGAYRDKGDFDHALTDFDRTVTLAPSTPEPYANRGYVRMMKGDYPAARKDFEVAIGLDPRNAWAHNQRAWFLATCPDAKYRDGAESVKSATIACEETGMNDPENLDTLAAANAEKGDFDAAIRVETRAIGLVPPSDRKTRADYESRLALYRKRTPYRERKAP